MTIIQEKPFLLLENSSSEQEKESERSFASDIDFVDNFKGKSTSVKVCRPLATIAPNTFSYKTAPYIERGAGQRGRQHSRCHRVLRLLHYHKRRFATTDRGEAHYGEPDHKTWLNKNPEKVKDDTARLSRQKPSSSSRNHGLSRNLFQCFPSWHFHPFLSFPNHHRPCYTTFLPLLLHPKLFPVSCTGKPSSSTFL